MMELKRVKHPAKPTFCGLFLANNYVKTGRDILALDIHDFPAVIASVYETTAQPT